MAKYFISIAFLFVASTALAGDCSVTSYFSPYDNVEDVVVEHLSNAQTSIHCSLYGITNPNITSTLIDKIGAGVEVSLCLDKTQSAGRYSTHKKLEKAGADVVIKKVAVLEHNKFCVIDGKEVIMGSWNFSGSAQKQDNSEVLLTGCQDTIDSFETAFQRIYDRDK
ncbi:MAG: phospholipase D-like domain-containing protein [Thermodesulfovibrionales bacterium]|jgi:phosphatidylserine/phosphatidylglycerophosphate/cardiolipin synthase-like enzyme